MQTTVKIKGMTCGHCEGRVNTELGKISGVTEVKAVAAEGVAVVTSMQALNSEEVLAAVLAAGYKVIDQLVKQTEDGSELQSSQFCKNFLVVCSNFLDETY